jgi:hypothetical protein
MKKAVGVFAAVLTLASLKNTVMHYITFILTSTVVFVFRNRILVFGCSLLYAVCIVYINLLTLYKNSFPIHDINLLQTKNGDILSEFSIWWNDKNHYFVTSSMETRDDDSVIQLYKKLHNDKTLFLNCCIRHNDTFIDITDSLRRFVLYFKSKDINSIKFGEVLQYIEVVHEIGDDTGAYTIDFVMNDDDFTEKSLLCSAALDLYLADLLM